MSEEFKIETEEDVEEARLRVLNTLFGHAMHGDREAMQIFLEATRPGMTSTLLDFPDA